MTQINRLFHHTPGPWIAYHELLTPNGLHVAGRSPMVRSGSHIIAQVGRFLNSRLNHAICQEAEANCRLISKAPEMKAYLMGRADGGDPNAALILREIDTAGIAPDGGQRPVH